ncbi:MAG: 4a-hydroxytetrahydrobiopterin dehydratase [Chloroflexi bacterium RBG_16_48_8]|jgi:4a-hydroxytetrahydrobiopterin dehydratase|nr:MAG: 4a-hydroxytetrahydrobiopterin dehydratase [Chloroflexi bacterium RBG_16_48_8]
MDKKKLTQQHCVPCSGNEPPVSKEEMDELKPMIPDWEIVVKNGSPRLRRTFGFPDFKEALKFTNKVGDIAEQEGHHPIITMTWGRVTVEWYTHAISNIHKNDFIMASKTDQIYEEKE